MPTTHTRTGIERQTAKSRGHIVQVDSRCYCHTQCLHLHGAKQALCCRLKLLSSGVDAHQPLSSTDNCENVFLRGMVPNILKPARRICRSFVSCQIQDNICWLHMQVHISHLLLQIREIAVQQTATAVISCPASNWQYLLCCNTGANAHTVLKSGIESGQAFCHMQPTRPSKFIRLICMAGGVASPNFLTSTGMSRDVSRHPAVPQAQSPMMTGGEDIVLSLKPVGDTRAYRM